ncbi:MAG: 3-hydroxyacyl-CoA dehydrogenase NAD-binding domain-containing protein [Gemmataceae bacterium]
MAWFETKNLSVDLHADHIAHVWLDVPERSHNVFGRQVLADMEAALERIEADRSIKLAVFLGRKKSGFVAGADIQEFQSVKTADDAAALSRRGQDLMNKVAGLRVPTVAVVHGPCLGGGLEFALACDYRVVLDEKGTQLGLPEIKLGLLPGWGGTQRLPRVVGLERSLHVILQQETLDAKKAKEWGLADAVFKTQPNAIEYIGAELFHKAKKRPKTGMPLLTGRQWLLESTGLGRRIILNTTAKILRAKVPDDMPAPFEAFEAVKTGMLKGMDAGFKQEREGIGRLATTVACRNLVTIFFLMMNARKADVEPDAEASELPVPKKIGVVGAGTMGAGIAQLAAIRGFDVVIQEVNDQALAAGVAKIEDLFKKAAEKGVLSREEARQKVAAIQKTTSWEGFGDVDLAVEAVIESIELKQKVFRTLEEKCRPDAILATNTSSLLVKQIQEGLSRPGRVAGMHFFNPVHKMPLVEVIRAGQTEERVAATVALLAAKLGKTPVIVGDSPGFVVNRILIPYLNEAGILLSEGMAVEKVDKVMKRFGMPMGPLELLDQVGLDVAAHIAKAVAPAFGERLPPHPALGRMVELGYLGQKSGKGFYVWSGKKKTVNAEALTKLGSEIKTKPSGLVAHEQERAARERMVCLMVNEAAMCFAEKLGERADVIDLAMVFGTGWAPQRGGPLRYADDRGCKDIVKSLEDLARRHGPRFQPCDELRRRAESGEPFYASLEEMQRALSA